MPANRRLWGLFSLILILLAGGCSTLEQRKAALVEIEQQGVSPDLYQRMLKGRKLTLPDFEQLAEKNVSDAAIIRYLASTGHVYYLTIQDLERLRNAKVSDAVINYLLSTRNRLYYYSYPAPYYFWDYPRYYYYPYPVRVPQHFHHPHPRGGRR